MEMRHSLAGMRTVVEDQPVTTLLEAQLFCHHCGFQQQVTEDLVIVRAGLCQAGNRLLGHDQDVRRRLWIDVAKGAHLVVFKYDLRRNFARDYFLKQCLAHAGSVAGKG